MIVQRLFPSFPCSCNLKLREVLFPHHVVALCAAAARFVREPGELNWHTVVTWCFLQLLETKWKPILAVLLLKLVSTRLALSYDFRLRQDRFSLVSSLSLDLCIRDCERDCCYVSNYREWVAEGESFRGEMRDESKQKKNTTAQQQQNLLRTGVLQSSPEWQEWESITHSRLSQIQNYTRRYQNSEQARRLRRRRRNKKEVQCEITIG